MTTLYARSDINQITVSGVGHSHKRKRGDGVFAVNCLPCEPTLRQLGWATDPRQVELTPDEVLDAENAQREIARFEQLQVAATAKEAAASVRAAGAPRRR